MLKWNSTLPDPQKADKTLYCCLKTIPAGSRYGMLKDLDASHNNIMPVGSGTIDFKRIFEHQKTAGMQHFFVEHDMPKDAFASIAESYKYITQVLKA